MNPSDKINIKNVVTYGFYLITNIILIFLLYFNYTEKTTNTFLILNILFLVLFYIKNNKKKIQFKFLDYLRLSFYFLLLNHIAKIGFMNVEYKNLEINFEALFLFVVFLFFLIESYKFFGYLSLIILFLLLVPPVSLMAFGHYSNLIILLYMICLFDLILYHPNYLRTLFYKEIPWLAIFLFCIIILSFIQFFYVFSLEGIFYHLKKIFLYLIFIITFLYFLREKKIYKIKTFLYYISIYTIIQLFFISSIFIFFYDKVYIKANDNFFAMYFDWAIFVILYPLFLKRSGFKKYISYFLISIILIFISYLIFLFRARTTMIIIPLTIFFVIIKYFINQFQIKNLSKRLHHLYGILFLLFYLSLYITLYLYTISMNERSILDRFFYWYTMFKYFINHPFYIFIGTGEYMWGYLYKYLTYDINQFPYLYTANINEFFDSHPHNDPLSFFMGGGIFYFLFYLFFIFIALIQPIQKNYMFIFFSIFVISIFHGITEPFSFSIYTGFIFWLSGIIIIFPSYTVKNPTKKNKLKEYIKLKKILRKIILIITLIVSIYFFYVYVLKKQVFKNYYSQTFHFMNELYIKDEFPLSDHNPLFKNIDKLTNFSYILTKWDFTDHHHYMIFADYLFLKSKLENKLDQETLIRIHDYLCKSFIWDANIYSYRRLQALYTKFPLTEKKCKNFERFDPYMILK